MTKNGFLVLVVRFLVQKFRSDKSLKSKDWLFSHTGSKIIVHGPNRNPTGDLDILAEITSCPHKSWICIELKANGTVTDRELLAKIIGDWAINATILSSPPAKESGPQS